MTKLRSFERRKQRIRSRIFKIVFDPNNKDYKFRLSIFRSNSHIYGQIIDDEKKVTLVAASTIEKDIAKKVSNLNKSDAAKLVGAELADRALKQGLKKVIFDKGGYKYHGRVKLFAEGARAQGLEF